MNARCEHDTGGDHYADGNWQQHKMRHRRRRGGYRRQQLERVEIMKSIEMKWLFTDGTTWTNSSDAVVQVTEDDSHPELKSMIVDGELHLIFDVQPFVDKSQGILLGHLCFVPTPGLEYRAILEVESQCPPEAVEQYWHHGYLLIGTPEPAII
jgi:hypothetical protein